MATKPNYLMFVVLLLATFAVAPHANSKTEAQRVLVLNAYHEGYHWTDRIMDGVRSVLDAEDHIEIFVDYMDTKRCSDQEYFSKLHDILAHKYRLLKFDAIVASDDHALNFLLMYRDELFPEVPVFFCGINDFHPDRIAGFDLATGVYETYDVPGTIELMLRLHPKTRNIAVINDGTLSGQTFLDRVERAEVEFVNLLEFQYLTNLSLKDLEQKLAELEENTLVLWGVYLRTPEGVSISSEESIRLITESCGRPVYCIWDVVGQGVVGGKITSPNFQGRAAAEMAHSYLHGTRIEDLPICGSPMVHSFDFQVMKRLDIPYDELPTGSLVMNRPYSAYEEYREIVWAVLGFGLTLVCVILALVYYIWKRKQAERALRDSMSQLEAISGNVADFILQSNREGNISYVNRLVPGMKMEKVLSSRVFDFVPENKHQTVKDALEIVFEKGTTTSCEIEGPGPDGSNRIYFVNVSPILLDNTVKAAVFLASDITANKRSEDERIKIQKLESIGVLAGGIAHDFNNLLMGLSGYISLAQDQLENDHPVSEDLLKAEKAMERAAKLSRQLLTFAKGGAPVREIIDLRKLVRDSIHFDLSGTNVKPVIECASDLRLVNVDKGQIQQVSSNLAINAAQAMKDGGHLYISMENTVLDDAEVGDLKAGDYVWITFRDEGVGIDPGLLNKVFDPYFTTKETGSGLGLTTIFSIIQKHHGHIEVDSDWGKGTTFSMYLPADDSRQIPEQVLVNKSTEPAQEAAKILIMDDEQLVLDVVESMLERLGYRPAVAPDGDTAIELYRQAFAEKQPFVAVIIDLTIPGGMGGKDAVKGILEINPDAKCIVSSGYSNDPICANHRDFGFVGVVDKPYSLDNLARVLNRALSQ